jgi:hypothetical protein
MAVLASKLGFGENDDVTLKMTLTGDFINPFG